MDHSARVAGPYTGLSAVTANGSSAAIAVPDGQYEVSVWGSSTGGPTTANVTTEVSSDGGTTWVAALSTFGTLALSTTPLVGAVVSLPPGTTHVRNTLAGLAGGVAPTVSTKVFFRQRF